MKRLATLLIVLGVCVGALGAAGFHTPHGASGPDRPSREPYALAVFLLGIVSLGAGGVLTRQALRSRAGRETLHAEKQTYLRELRAIRDIVVELDEQRTTMEPEAIRKRIGNLLGEEYFDLTSRSDDLIRLVGFNDYARVWDGVATAERLLARCWSMITDGHPEEGVTELPHARANIETAAEAMASIS